MTKLVFGILFTSAAVWAQTSQINGTVKDPTGASIPGAAVKATQTATGVVRTTEGQGDGDRLSGGDDRVRRAGGRVGARRGGLLVDCADLAEGAGECGQARLLLRPLILGLDLLK